MKDYAVELFCGCFGGTAGFIEIGVPVLGFDIEHLPHHGPVPEGAMLVLQDVLTIHGSQLKESAFMWASPPCTEFSYMSMPWSRGKQIASALRGRGEFPKGYTGSRTIIELTALFMACFRIQREASEAAGRYIPLIVENVRGAQPWVGKAKWNYGSFYLWGDVPALMPIMNHVKAGDRCKDRDTGKWTTGWNVSNAQEYRKNSGGSWFNIAHNTESGVGQNPDGRKLPGNNGPRQWDEREVQQLGDAMKTVGHANMRDGHSHTRHLTNQRESDAVKQHGSGPIWFDTGIAKHSSKSNSRKAASAQIAKIPFALSRHIARCFKPIGVYS